MKAIDHLRSYGITPRLKTGGKIGLQGMRSLSCEVKAEVITWARDNRGAILQELDPNVLNAFTSKGFEADLTPPEIEPMTNCLHSSRCKQLNGPDEHRPFCSKAEIPVFDLKSCPLCLWERRPEIVKDGHASSRRRKTRLVNKPMVETWRKGRQWIRSHLPDLEKAGWNKRELLRAGRFIHPCGTWGVAWFWKPDVTPTLEPDGAIRWLWKNANGKAVTQAARPKNPIERKKS